MNAERWKQIDELFDAVLEIPNERREAFLLEKCAGDDDLKREVLSLLDAQRETDGFLERSAMNMMAKELAHNRQESFSFVGKEFGAYKIEKQIGAGGMGEVYLALHGRLNRKVALKILPAEFVADTERIKRLEREARIVSALNHPYIVTIYAVGSADGVNYIAAEYVEGETVRDLINRGVDLKQTLSVISQTCEALAAAHKAGIVHRDIKPENIMVRSDGFVKVLDFGLAKLNAQPDSIHVTLTNYTQKGVIIGTPAYMSPAQVSDDKVDHRTDLWSVGVCLYEMLTNVNPFKGESRQATFQKILSENPPLISELNDKLPRELDAILRKVLEKDADVSYQTASDLGADLKRVRREIDSSSSLRSISETTKKSTNKTRSKYLSAVAGAVALFLIGFGLWFSFKQSKSEKSVESVEWAQAKHSPLTDSYEAESHPSLSPDGKDFIYTSQSDGGNNDIFRQRIGGKNPSNLTANSSAGDSMGAFSPNGKLIAFRSERKPRGIYLMEETGENVRLVSDMGFHPSWSPDGKQIVVSDKPSNVATSHTVPNGSLWIIDVETGNKRQLDTKGDAIQPSWSPNGKRIAFWFVEEGKLGDIATISATGGEPVRVTNDDIMDWNPVWSPDGKYVYFGSDRGGNMNIWRSAVDEETGAVSGEPESITTPSSYIRHLAFSRDGKMLAYIRYETQSNLQSVAFDPERLKTVGELNMVTRGTRQVSTPALSPNGEDYVLRYPSITQEDIAIFSRDGSNLRYLTSDKFRDRTPRWSPDGKRVAFASDRSGKYQIWTINGDGSNLIQTTFSEKTGASAPIFSPDGTRLIFSGIDGKKQTPFTLDLRKSWHEQTVAPLPPPPNFNGSYSAHDWSADGNKLLISLFDAEDDENGISVFDFKTATYEKMLDSGSYPIWLKDNRHFIFEKQNTIFAFDTQTKKTTEIYKPSSYAIQHANVSPDNRLIYFRYLQVDANVWLLDASQNH